MKHYSTILTAILVFLAVLATAGTGLYYAVGFGWVSMGVAVVVAVVAAFWLTSPRSPILSSPRSERGSSNPDWMPDHVRHDSRLTTIVSLLILSLDIIALASLFIFRMDDAIRSPWEVVPPIYFLLFWVASLLLILLADSRWTLPLAIVHTFTGWSVALLVYQLGYGFDPFIHQAAEKIIAAGGVVRPLTPYYIGQYVLVVTIHRLTMIPLDLIDRWLLPVLASISVPFALHNYSDTLLTKVTLKITLLAPLATLLPATPFIMTTPQGLGSLWLLITAFSLSSLRGAVNGSDEAISRLPRSLRSLTMTSLFALAAAATHPIAGVPALALVAFSVIARKETTKQSSGHSGLLRILRVLAMTAVFVLSSLALPLALSRYRGTHAIATATAEPVPIWLAVRDAFILPLTPDIQDHADWPLDFAYLIRKNLALIIVGLAIIGYLYTCHPERSEGSPQILRRFAPQDDGLILTAASLSISYLLMTTRLTFSGLINYEAGIFPQRLREAAAIVLLPLAAVGVGWIYEHARRDRWTKIVFVLLTASALTASVYLSYPRIDRYEKSSGRSVSAAMIEAVNWVENDRNGHPSVVLADQNAAAIQIHEYGFGPYYQSNYFYSHPSGSLGLYRYFQAIVEDFKSPHETARAAADFAGVQRVYLIVPSYWKTFAPVVSAAKKESATWTSLHDGDVYVFRF